MSDISRRHCLKRSSRPSLSLAFRPGEQFPAYVFSNLFDFLGHPVPGAARGVRRGCRKQYDRNGKKSDRRHSRADGARFGHSRGPLRSKGRVQGGCATESGGEACRRNQTDFPMGIIYVFTQVSLILGFLRPRRPHVIPILFGRGSHNRLRDVLRRVRYRLRHGVLDRSTAWGGFLVVFVHCFNPRIWFMLVKVTSEELGYAESTVRSEEFRSPLGAQTH